MSQPQLYRRHCITVYRQGQTEPVEAPVVVEIPLTILLNNTELATLICSPGSYKELVVGFLLCEGLLKHVDINKIISDEENRMVWVHTDGPVSQTENFLRRSGASGGGKGRSLIDFINAAQVQPVRAWAQFFASELLQLIRQLDEQSATFQMTGGVHSAALADREGLLVRYEDIGRHNAVDRVLGYLWLRQITPEGKCLVLSGRVSSEILFKAARGGLALILSRSAPTMLALELAEQLGITVVGFARGQQFNVYSYAERVVL